jgi:SOS response regulatory protein OraA/RecX
VINVASEEKILYNKREKDFYLLMKLINAETLEEMEEIVKRNEIMEQILEEMKKFSEEEYVQDYHAQEVLIKSQHNSEMKKSKEEVVRKMLLKGFNDSDIIDVTNISSKDLEKIKLNMKEA